MSVVEQERDRTYNGWTNYATWGVALVLDNDEGTYNEVRERATEIAYERGHNRLEDEPAMVRSYVADFLKNYTEELCGIEGDLGVPRPTLMAQQVIKAGLAEVNWDEIAENVLAE